MICGNQNKNLQKVVAQLNNDFFNYAESGSVLSGIINYDNNNTLTRLIIYLLKF